MGHDRTSSISSKSDKDEALATTHRVTLALATKCEILKTLNIETRFLRDSFNMNRCIHIELKWSRGRCLGDVTRIPQTIGEISPFGSTHGTDAQRLSKDQES